MAIFAQIKKIKTLLGVVIFLNVCGVSAAVGLGGYLAISSYQANETFRERRDDVMVELRALEQRPELQDRRAQLQKAQQSLVALPAPFTGLSMVLFGIGLFIVLTGLVVPLLIFQQLARQIEKAQQTMVGLVAETVKEIMTQWPQRPDEPLRDMRFWLRMGTSIFERLAPRITSPFWLMLGETLRLLRLEVDRNPGPVVAGPAYQDPNAPVSTTPV